MTTSFKKPNWIMFVAVLLACTGAAVPARAQHNIDSLWGAWKNTALPDTQRLKALNQYTGKRFLHSDPDSAMHYGEVMFAFAEAKGARKFMGQALVLQGRALSAKGDRAGSIEHLERAVELFESIDDKRDLMVALNNIGNGEMERGDLAHAIEHLTRSLKIAEELGDSSLVARMLGNIGGVYHQQEDTANAMVYYQRRVAMAKAIGQKDILGEGLSNMGVIHQQRKEYERAIAEYEEALALAREIGYREMEHSSLHNLGALYIETHDFARAMDMLEQALAVAKAVDNQNGEAYSLTSIGEVYLALGDASKAVSSASQGLALARATQDISAQQEAAKILYKAQKALGNGREALAMHELWTSLRDSVVNDENKQEIMSQRFQYDYEKKEALLQAEQEKKDAIAAEELRRKNLQRNAFIGGFGLMVLLAGVFFTQRNRISKEKKRSEELLLNILPAEVAEELKAKGEADAKQIEQVTVLFTDFKGFTAMSEQLSPKELVRDIHECFSAFDHIMAKHGIEKIKTIGDAYMAAGGLPTPNTTHALDVVKAALEIRDFIAQGKAQKVAAGLPYFEIRIGIHTGPVVAGIVGVKKFAYDIWGDTVNTASRMESSGEVGQVNISEATFALVREQAGNLFHFTARGKVQAKGKGEMEMYFVDRH